MAGDDGVYRPQFGSASDLFSIKLHHGGEFVDHPVRVYLGVEVDYIDNCDADRMSLSELDDIGLQLGYAPYIGFCYKIPGSSLDDGLVRIISDKHVLDMIDCLPKSRASEMYTVHPGGIKLLEGGGEKHGNEDKGVDAENMGEGTKEANNVDDGNMGESNNVDAGNIGEGSNVDAGNMSEGTNVDSNSSQRVNNRGYASNLALSDYVLWSPSPSAFTRNLQPLMTLKKLVLAGCRRIVEA